MDLVIMAAGMGSRFGGLKQVEPINENGEFIIDYSIFDAIKVGFNKVVFIIKKENYDLFRETVGKRVENKIKVEYVFQEIDKLPKGFKVPDGRVKPWGTGHAILCCKNVVKDNFAIINADDFYGFDAFKTVADYLKDIKPNTFGLVGYKVKNTITENGATKRGVCKTEAKYLKKIIESNVEIVKGKIVASPLDNPNESSEISPETIVSMNMWGFTPKIFDFLEVGFKKYLQENLTINPLKCEYLIPSVVDEEVKLGNVKVEMLKTSAVWYGVTYKEDKPFVVESLKKLTLKGVYPKNLWN